MFKKVINYLNHKTDELIFRCAELSFLKGKSMGSVEMFFYLTFMLFVLIIDIITLSNTFIDIAVMPIMLFIIYRIMNSKY